MRPLLVGSSASASTSVICTSAIPPSFDQPVPMVAPTRQVPTPTKRAFAVSSAVAALHLARRQAKSLVYVSRSAPASAARSRASCIRFSLRSPSTSRRSRRRCAMRRRCGCDLTIKPRSSIVPPPGTGSCATQPTSGCAGNAHGVGSVAYIARERASTTHARKRPVPSRPSPPSAFPVAADMEMTSTHRRAGCPGFSPVGPHHSGGHPLGRGLNPSSPRRRLSTSLTVPWAIGSALLAMRRSSSALVSTPSSSKCWKRSPLTGICRSRGEMASSVGPAAWRAWGHQCGRRHCLSRPGPPRASTPVLSLISACQSRHQKPSPKMFSTAFREPVSSPQRWCRKPYPAQRWSDQSYIHPLAHP